MSNEIIRIQDDNIYTLPTTFGNIRCTMINNDIYMVGKDVAECLGYIKPRNAINKYVPDDEKMRPQIKASSKWRAMTFITESGLYRLALRSKLPKAQEFADWVVKEVLPSIRKNGQYVVTANDQIAQAIPVMDIANPKMLIHQYIDDLCEKSGCTHTSAWVLFREVMSKYYDIDIKHEKMLHARLGGKDVSSLYILDGYNLLNKETVDITRSLVYDCTDYDALFDKLKVPSNIADSYRVEPSIERYSVINSKRDYQLNAIMEKMPEAFGDCVGRVTMEEAHKTYAHTHRERFEIIPVPFSIAEGF